MERGHGRVVNVSQVQIGSEVAADADVAATVLVLADASPFDETGGWLVIAAEDGTETPLAYTGVLEDPDDPEEDTDTLTLAAPLAAAVAEGSLVHAWDGDPTDGGQPVVETEVDMVDDDQDGGDPWTATLTEDLVDTLPEGARDLGRGESVVWEREEAGGEIFVVQILGAPLVRDGSFLQRDTVEAGAIDTAPYGEPRVFIRSGDAAGRPYVGWSIVGTNGDPAEVLPAFVSASSTENNSDLGLSDGHGYLLTTPPSRGAWQWTSGRRQATGLLLVSAAEAGSGSTMEALAELAAELIRLNADDVETTAPVRLADETWHVVDDTRRAGPAEQLHLLPREQLAPEVSARRRRQRAHAGPDLDGRAQRLGDVHPAGRLPAVGLRASPRAVLGRCGQPGHRRRHRRRDPVRRRRRHLGGHRLHVHDGVRAPTTTPLDREERAPWHDVESPSLTVDCGSPETASCSSSASSASRTRRYWQTGTGPLFSSCSPRWSGYPHSSVGTNGRKPGRTPPMTDHGLRAEVQQLLRIARRNRFTLIYIAVVLTAMLALRLHSILC